MTRRKSPYRLASDWKERAIDACQLPPIPSPAPDAPGQAASAGFSPVTLHLTLRVMPSSVPWPIRLRKLLKYAQNAVHLKCETFHEVKEPPP